MLPCSIFALYYIFKRGPDTHPPYKLDPAVFETWCVGIEHVPVLFSLALFVRLAITYFLLVGAQAAVHLAQILLDLLRTQAQ